LYIIDEVYQTDLELDDMYDVVSTIYDNKTEVIADSARPDLIKFLKRKGMIIRGAKKTTIFEGVKFLKNFKKIYIDYSCKNTFKEFSSYVYKKSKISGRYLEEPEDDNNHAIDAIRYGLEPVFKMKQKARSSNISASLLGL
jgi:phage terminase large subunit